MVGGEDSATGRQSIPSRTVGELDDAYHVRRRTRNPISPTLLLNLLLNPIQKQYMFFIVELNFLNSKAKLSLSFFPFFSVCPFT
jgi:hypothetical protein